MPPRRKASAPSSSTSEGPLHPIQASSTRTRTSRSSASTTKSSTKASLPVSTATTNTTHDFDEEMYDVKPASRSRTARSSVQSSANKSSNRLTNTRSNRATTTSLTSTRPNTASGTITKSKEGVKESKARSVAGKPQSKRISEQLSTEESSEGAPEEPQRDSEEDDEEEEDVRVMKRKPAVNPRGKKVVESSEDEMDHEAEQENSSAEEEIDVKPIIKRGKPKRKISIIAQPIQEEDEHVSSEASSDDSAEGENSDQEQIQPKKSKRAETKNSASSKSGSQDLFAESKPLITRDSTPDSDEEVAAELLAGPSTPRVIPATPEKKEPIKPVVVPPTPHHTSQDLATQAKLAALNHAAQEKEREKEREGKPRLVIHQLVLQDFKSYRGRGVIGPFHKSFSSIVGPNGSGKSNTIDALLFVFGYRATKMRQGKLSELIHNSGAVVTEEEAAQQDDAAVEGAEFEDGASEESDSEESGKKKKGKKGAKGKKNLPEADQTGLIQSCTVEVWFREIIDLPGGRDEFEVVPGSQLVVARTAYRNNSSRYTINGKVSNFTEVTTLLKARGIDLDHKRFLILQGEVESIAQMKPKGVSEHDEGLLEYLEDIIGTSGYKLEIEHALVEVERLNELRAQQLNRVKLVEREKTSLEGRKKECDGYLRDQNELVHNQSALFQLNIHVASSNAHTHRKVVEQASAELEAEIEEQSETRAEVDSLQAEFNEMAKDCKDTEKATSEIVKHLAVLDRAEIQLQEKKKSAANKLKKAKKSVTDDTHAKSEADTWVRNHSEVISTMTSEIETLERSLEKEEAELEKIRDGLKGKTEIFQTEIESLQKDLQPWAEQIARKQAEIDLITNEKDLLTEKSDAVKIGLKEAEAVFNKLARDDELKTEQLSALVSEKERVESQVAAVQAKLDSFQAQDSKLRQKVSVARQKSEEAKASQSASRSTGNLLTTLNKLRDQGRLPGFHGRLGNLGRIDDKYDVAISTACPGLDNLVTDTISVAQNCIEILRKQNLGRANLMALDKTAVRNMSPIETPDGAKRLFDLVTPKEPKFAPCFYQLLQNTLVANDLEQGKRLAFRPDGKRWRVVTLDGQLIDTSGTMSGGGNRPIKGKMSSKIQPEEVSPEQVAKCEQEHSHAVQTLRTFTAERSELETELNALKSRLPEIEMGIEKFEMDLNTSEKRIQQAKLRYKELKAQSKPDANDAKQISQLDTQISSLTNELEKLREKSSLIETKIKTLQDKILEVGGVKLRGQQSSVIDLKAQIEHASERLTKAEVGKVKSEKDSTKFSKQIETNQQILAQCETELNELTQQIKSGEDEVSAVRDAVAKASAVLEAKREELGEMKKALDERLEIITQFRKREMEIKTRIDSEAKLLKDAEKAILYWSDKVADLVLNEMEEDDDDDEETEATKEKNSTPEREEISSQRASRSPKPDNSLHQYSDQEIAALNPNSLKAKISALEERISKSTLDLSVLKEYARREKEFLQRAADLDAVTRERDAAKHSADELRAQRLKEFMAGFGIISMKLKEMYQMITLGGNAELELVDSLDPFSEGIIFSVMPPKKSWKNISNLSGGEKTLSSLALVFALHVFKPTPLYFMDEIDAALDFRNVSIVANYIKDRTKNAQFIIISLRNNMFELSSRLIGIYKVANQTRSVAIDNRELSQLPMVPTPA